MADAVRICLQSSGCVIRLSVAKPGHHVMDSHTGSKVGLWVPRRDELTDAARRGSVIDLAPDADAEELGE